MRPTLELRPTEHGTVALHTDGTLPFSVSALAFRLPKYIRVNSFAKLDSCRGDASCYYFAFGLGNLETIDFQK